MLVLSQEPVKRILALTETCLVERDPASYNIVTVKPFGEVRLIPESLIQLNKHNSSVAEIC